MSRSRTTGLVLFLLTLVLYAPVRNHDFVNYDDPLYVTENRQVQAGVTLAGLRWAFTTWHASNWHPLTWLSHMLDVEWFGVQAGAHHVINVLLHAANAVLLFLLLKRMTGAHWPAAVVAGFFAWHPLHVESVAWIAERKDVLSTLFWLLAMWNYASFVAQGVKPRGGHAPLRGRRGAFWLAVLCFALGLMSKPMLVTLPFVLLLMDYWPLGRSAVSERVSEPASSHSPTHGTPRHLPSARLLIEKWPFLVLTAASCVVTFLAQSGRAVQSFDEVSPGTRVANALMAYTRYLAKTVWPVDLAVFYPLPRQFPIWQGALALALLIVISLRVWRGKARRPYLLVGWLWFLGTLVPVIGLVQVGGQALADRYTYVPMVGLLIMLAWGGHDLVSRWRLRDGAVSESAPSASSHSPAHSLTHSPTHGTSRSLAHSLAAVATGGALAACMGLTWVQESHWMNTETLFTRALAVTGDNAVARINLGLVLEREGRRDEALAHYLEALRLEPRRPQAHANLANLLDAMGRFDEAVAHYHEALRLRPREALVFANLGLAYAGQGRWDEAVSNYLQAIEFQPSEGHTHYLLGLARLRQGRTDFAISSLREALRLKPDHVKALNQLARILAAAPDPKVRNGLEATRLAQQAAELTGHQQPAVLDTLAMAHAEAGRFEEARAAAARAMELLQSIGGTNEAAAIRQRLQLYQANQPYREVP